MTYREQGVYRKVRGCGVRGAGGGWRGPFGEAEAFGAVHRATRRSRVARSASRRARDRGRESTTASQRRSPPPALRSRIATGAAANSQEHQPSPQDVSRETFVPIPRLAHTSPARGSVQAGAERIACSVFGRKAAPMPMLPEANSGRNSSEDLATWAYAVRLSENLARPARNAVRNWHGCRFAPTSLAAAPGRARMFHVKHSFVAWGGRSPRASPERGAASTTRCGPGSLSFGRTSDGRTRLRACLAPR